MRFDLKLTDSKNLSVFLFPHQDDEYFIGPRVRYEIARGKVVRCIFLTRSPNDQLNRARNDESLKYLARLGVPQENIYFLGTSQSVMDGFLVEHLRAAQEQVLAWLGFEVPHRIYIPAWEGGHQDHDAAHLLGVSLGKRLGCPAWQFYTYNGYRTRWKFFRVMSPPREPMVGGSRRRLGCRELWKHAWSCWGFRSQWKTWVCLFPFCFFKFMFKRVEVLDPVNLEQLEARPHSGDLLYERHGRLTYREFCLRARDFLPNGSSTS